MRHHCLSIVAAFTAGIVLGCGPGKQLPDDIPKAQGTARSTDTPKENIPATSDPAAIEIVDRAIKAHTQNNPALLAKAKLSKLTANGTIKLPVDNSSGPVPVPSTRIFIARWPNEFRLSNEFKSHIPGTMTNILRGSLTWWGLNSEAKPVPDPQAFEEWMRTDATAIHWIPLLFPLREPGAIVFDAKKGTGTPKADSVRLSLPGRPIYTLSFDPDTGYLTRVSYTHSDSAGWAFKEWLVSDPKPFEGMMLPTKMQMARTTRSHVRDVVEEWTAAKWEFPEKIEESAFDPPK